jgi:acetyl esterase
MKNRALLSLAASGLMLMASCQSSNTTTDSDTAAKDSAMTDTMAVSIMPTGKAPDWGPNLKPEMQAVIEKLVSYGDKPNPELTAAEARKNHTPTDAVMDLMKENNIPMPVMKVDTMGKEIPVEGGNIHIRVYTPQAGNGPFPVIVYYHGGGFVILMSMMHPQKPYPIKQELWWCL